MSIVDIGTKVSFALPRERVFEALLDHEAMSKWTPAKVRVIARGDERGVGTVRRLRLGALSFDEEVTYADAPSRIVYRIVRGVPLDFHRGEVLLSETGDGKTEVTWNVRLVSMVPGVAESIGAVLRPGLRGGLRQLAGLIGG